MPLKQYSLAAVAVVALSVAAPAVASVVTLSGDEIRMTVSGYTVEGSMLDTGRYSEFYATDGVIRGDGYTGVWSIEGDTMCFKYGDDPADCFSVGFESGAVIWIKDGELLGTGTRREGNPNNF